MLDFPQQYSPEITIGHLLTQTSGIADCCDEEKVMDFDQFSVSRPWCELKEPRDYLAVFPDEPMKFPPGTRLSYSNGGACTTADDLAKSWKAFWAREVLPPDLVEVFASPSVKTATEGKATYSGHGMWIDLEPGGHPEVYIVGGDAQWIPEVYYPDVSAVA